MKRNKNIGIVAGIVGAVGAVLTFSWLRHEQSEAKLAARSPFGLPWASHRSLVGEVMSDMNAGNTMTLAAGIAYFAALAFFPSFAAMFAIASILIPQEQVAHIIGEVNVYLPQDIAGLVTVQLENQTDKHSGNIIFAIIAIAIALFAACCWLVFRLAPWLVRLLGQTGINVITRIMGLLLMALGIEFIVTGLRALFPGLLLH